MNWEVMVDQKGLGLFSSTVYVEAPNIVKAIKIAEEYIIEETAASKPRVYNFSKTR